MPASGKPRTLRHIHVSSSGVGPEPGQVYINVLTYLSVNNLGDRGVRSDAAGGGAGIFTVDEGRITRIIDTDGATRSRVSPPDAH